MPARFLLVVFSIFVFLSFFQPIETEDVWVHLSTGRWIISHMQVPRQDPFPFAQEQTPWVCYEWLGSTILYLKAKMGGMLGLKVFRSFFFMLVIGLAFLYGRRRLPFSVLMFLMTLMAYGLLNRLFLKPDIFNFLFIPFFLALLFDYENGGSGKKLFLLPLAGMPWFNIHIGAFIYGLPLISIFFLSRLAAGKDIKTLGAVLVLYLAGFLVNPFGFEGFLFPFKVFLSPGFIDFYKISANILETQPPKHIFLSFGYFYFFLLALFGAAVLFFNKKNNFSLTLLFIFSLFAFLYMARNCGFFTIVAVYVVAEGAGRLAFKDIWQRLAWSKIVDRVLLGVIALFLVFRIFEISRQEFYYDGQAVKALAMETNPLAAAAVETLTNNIRGPVFNQDVLGGWLIWSGYPALRPFQDGRNVDKERFNNTMAILSAPEKVWPIAERDYGFKAVALNTANDSFSRFIAYINAQPSWQLIKVSGPLVIYVKRGEFKLPAELDQLESRLKSATVGEQDIEELKQLAEQKQPSALEELLHPSPGRVDLFSDGLTLAMLGYKGAAVRDLVQALKISRRPYMQSAAIDALKHLGIGVK